MHELPPGQPVGRPRSTWDTTACPECDALAEVQWRAVLESTDGPVEHAKILCAQRHWFLMPVAGLTPGPGARVHDGTTELSRIGVPDADPPGA